jgi:hypothetical protein
MTGWTGYPSERVFTLEQRERERRGERREEWERSGRGERRV